MSEHLSLVREAQMIRRAGEALLVATVVRVRGSSYRRPGARLLVAPERWVAGSISGGCLEGDIVKRGFWRTREVPAVLVTYDHTSDDDIRSGFGLGCDGVIEVLLERLDEHGACDPIAFLERCLQAERSGALVTIFRSNDPGAPPGSRLTMGPDGIATTIRPRLTEELILVAREALARRGTTVWRSRDGQIEALVEVIHPPPHLFVFGVEHDAVPVVSLAKSIGWGVSCCMPQGRFSSHDRFLSADHCLVVSPGAVGALVDARARPLAVVMSHDYEQDRATLGALLLSRARYIGMLGPRRRSERMFAELERAGTPLRDEDLARIHAPAGLHLGADTPQEIALAIIAEAQAHLAGAQAGRLRERDGSIHGGTPASLTPEANAE